MGWLEAAILGAIQGLTEFLPVSSTGHLFLGRHFFGLDEAGLFLDTMLHLGTLIALVIIYWTDLLAIVRRPLSRLSILLILGTIPAIVVGLTFRDFFEEISRTGVTIGWEFIATGLILWYSDNLKGKGFKNVNDISNTDVLIIGTFQAVAILPAISRSGLTIAAALIRKVNKDTAAYFSFLLSIPAVAGAVLLQSYSLYQGQMESMPLSSLFIGTVMAGVFGYLAVKWMFSIIKRGSLKVFSVYVLLLGIIVLFAQFTGRF
ncbi:MAG: undecaprenyl-diphosphate phosphatase [Desulfotomaculaceae bacterium]|nr:undecaprenyl-diphosphate phosphatase [Desulfotomaculaceae bacterium]